MARAADNRSERGLVGLLCLLGFLVVGVTSLFTSTAAHTLFLTHNSPSALAYCYLGFAVVMPLVGTCYLRMQALWRLRTLITIALTVDVVTSLCFRGALLFGWEQSLSFGLKIWYDAELVLTSLVFWGLANQLMTVRQGKRLF